MAQIGLGDLPGEAASATAIHFEYHPKWWELAH